MSDNSPRLWCIRWALLVAGLLASAPSPASAQPAASWPWGWSGNPADLHHLSFDDLDNLFHQATIHEMPHGWFPGTIIGFTNMPAPEFVKRMAGNHWKGKIFEPDGNFINQWKNVQALHSSLKVGPSFLDGQPCFICEYPRSTPLFGPVRDEYREIAPGLFLGRMYRRVPHVKFLGYNYLQLSDCQGAFDELP